MQLLAVSCALFLVLTACGDDGGSTASDGGLDASVNDASVVDSGIVDATPADADLSPDADLSNPLTLAATGLYSSGEILASGVQAYTVDTQLWTDGATKRRWIKLPQGSTIDSSSMDFWTYPEGTKIWKEFTRDNIRVETRMLWKQGPTSNDWFTMAYLWNDLQSQALAVPNGANNANGTEHDVPSAVTCRECHGRQPDYVLGFSAISLDHSLGGITLATLVSDSRLSDPPTGSPPYFPLPGNATEQAALRYLHVNCGDCHHQSSPLMPAISIDMRLYVDSLATVAGTPTFTSTVGVPATIAIDAAFPALIEAGDPSSSAIHIRMNALDSKRMPPFGTEKVDIDGLAAVDAWISSL